MGTPPQNLCHIFSISFSLSYHAKSLHGLLPCLSLPRRLKSSLMRSAMRGIPGHRNSNRCGAFMLYGFYRHSKCIQTAVLSCIFFGEDKVCFRRSSGCPASSNTDIAVPSFPSCPKRKLHPKCCCSIQNFHRAATGVCNLAKQKRNRRVVYHSFDRQWERDSGLWC